MNSKSPSKQEKQEAIRRKLLAQKAQQNPNPFEQEMQEQRELDAQHKKAREEIEIKKKQDEEAAKQTEDEKKKAILKEKLEQKKRETA